MTMYSLCQGGGKPCCETCFRNADRWPADKLRSEYQSWVGPTPQDGEHCANYLADPYGKPAPEAL